MIFDATVAGRTLRVEVRPREDGRFTVTVDGRALDVDYQPAGGDFASLLVDGRSYEAGLERLDAGYRVVLTDDTLDVIAVRCGFGTAETLRRSFRRRLGVAPDSYRRRFRTVA